MSRVITYQKQCNNYVKSQSDQTLINKLQASLRWSCRDLNDLPAAFYIDVGV